MGPFRILAFGAGLTLVACRPVHRTLQDLPPQVMLYGVHLTYFQGNEVAATGTADRLTYARQNSDFVSSNAWMHFPGKRGNALAGMELKAPEVRGNLADKRADGIGGVAMQSNGGMTGHTERAHFDGQTMLLQGKDPISLQGPGYELDAQSFVFHCRESSFDFTDASSRFQGRR